MNTSTPYLVEHTHDRELGDVAVPHEHGVGDAERDGVREPVRHDDRRADQVEQLA